ncbi:MAG: chitobiase/beta-hexosaminidase C-terminal domain-containing protein [Lachnospiraceae bacterium]|nr:chitobiase/beta-hexosaminidase C-terminal domain-containing protein [Lachnospiraceae bacterium]
MGDEQLMCEHCGHEIMLVAEYDPALEDQKNNKDLQLKKKDAKMQFSAHVFAGLLILVTALAILLVLHNQRVSSLGYQLEQASSLAGEGNYDEAIAFLEKAKAMDPENDEYVFMETEYYLAMGNEARAREMLFQIIGDESAAELHTRAYTRLIELYSSHGDYLGIVDFLEKAPEEVQESFQEYLAPAPSFSVPEGSYDSEIALKILAQDQGRIFYTMDGSEPTGLSLQYTSPIFLTGGDYEVRAVYINTFGVRSEVVGALYHVHMAEEERISPAVDLYSGDYEHATFITAKAPEGWTIYYTTKGEDPTEKSNRYQGPVPMPLGETVMKFIAFNEEHEASEITEREYSLHIKTDIRVSDAVQDVVNHQIFMGKILNPEGMAADFTGIYTYRMFYCIPFEDYGDFYLIYEFFQDLAGVNAQTGDIFAVSLIDGTVTKAFYDRAGSYYIEGLEPKE